MKHKSEQHQRRSIRLKGYDYSQAGAYFVTICTHNRECYFGTVRNGVVELSKTGEIAWQCWQEIPFHFEPNHVHGIIVVESVGVQYIEPLRKHQYQKVIPNSIGSAVRSYKAAITRCCRKNGHGHFRWQRNFYERVIRNDDELNRIRKYIIYNPARWEEDRENPKNWTARRRVTSQSTPTTETDDGTIETAKTSRAAYGTGVVDCDVQKHRKRG